MPSRDERVARYSEVYLGNLSFEAIQAEARRRAVEKALREFHPAVVVEVGPGPRSMVDHARALTDFSQWLVVEPNREFAERAREVASQHEGAQVFEGFVEDHLAIRNMLGGDTPDLVISSSILHEVEQPKEYLDAIHVLLASKAGVVHISVPNAFSLHRRLARAMGLISDEHDLTNRNQLLEQFRVYNQRLLANEVKSAGFVIEESGGYFLKPFTHDQMQLLPFLTQELLDGLWEVGYELPDLASEIYVNARAIGLKKH